MYWACKFYHISSSSKLYSELQTAKIFKADFLKMLKMQIGPFSSEPSLWEGVRFLARTIHSRTSVTTHYDECVCTVSHAQIIYQINGPFKFKSSDMIHSMSYPILSSAECSHAVIAGSPHSKGTSNYLGQKLQDGKGPFLVKEEETGVLQKPNKRTHYTESAHITRGVSRNLQSK